jgi:hypothetical protein
MQLNANVKFTPVLNQTNSNKRVSLQVRQMLMASGTQRVWSKAQQVPYLIYGSNQWVGYDDVLSLTGKVSFVLLRSLQKIF